MNSLLGHIRIPALVDMHVHFREPGFAYKESILSGSRAAMCAGYSDVFTMPNLNPAPDTLEHLSLQTKIIVRDSLIGVHPYASITLGQKGEGELVNIEQLHGLVAGFSDDGRGIQDASLMREAMRRIAAVDGLIVEHCEVNSLLRGGYIHDGAYARMHGHKGICSESEWREVERNIRLSEETGCRLHVCHISTKESVELIREAKKSGIRVTTETAPHYLLLNERMLQEDGSWKMNPPIRSVQDQMALLAGVQDGTIDVIATDHAPHSKDEKNRGLAGSAFGIVGIETAFPLLYTYLVKPGLLSMERLIELMSTRAREIMGLPMDESWATFDLDAHYTIDPESFLSQGKSTPFAGWEVWGKCVKNEYKGNVVYEAE
ncbi:MAG: dihydroorotase [Paludibacteraceae bacterium]|nr:dihydroorotase [Paludibacteraceae bacterium]